MKSILGLAAAGVALSSLLLSAEASAVTLDVVVPEPTLHGTATSFSAELADASGEAQIRWDFGDGTITDFSTNAGDIEHTYADPGHYTVSALAQDDGGFASFSFIHTVHTPPTLDQPRSSSPLILDEERGLYVAANPDNGTVTLVDAEELSVVAEIEVFDHPVAVALAPSGELWVLDQDNYAVGIVDLDLQEMVDFFRLPYASLPVGIVFSKAGDAFVTLMGLGDVVRIDGSTHELVEQKHVAPFLRGITVSGDGATLWVTRFISQGTSGQVFQLDAETLQTTLTYEVIEDTITEDSDVQGRGLPNYLFSVAVSPDGTRAWIPSKKDNMARGLMRDGLALTQDTAVRPLVSILDLTTGEELFDERIDLDDRNLPRQVTFTPLGDWAFVSVFGSNLVELRDAFDGSFVTALRGEKMMGPVASVYTSDGRLAVLADLKRTLVVYDVADLLTGVDQATNIIAEVELVAEEKLSAEVLRGKQVFANAEDKRMASEGYLSCSSCHFEGFEDGLVWDFFDRGEGFRNTTSLLGRRGTGHGRVHWSANFDEIQDFEGPIRAHQGGLGFLSAEDFEANDDPLGSPKAGLDTDLDALAAYVTSLDRVPRSPFRNSDGTLTTRAVRGQMLFSDLGCDSCHGGNDFTDSAEGELHDVGTLTEYSGSRLGGDLPGIDTPTLLGVWQTAPYLHDGSAATLLDVLTTRNPDDEHGETSGLSDDELSDLVAYLEQIDDGEPPIELVLPGDGEMGGSAGSMGEAGSGADTGSGGKPSGGGSGGASSVSGGASSGGKASSSGGVGEAGDSSDGGEVDPMDPGGGCGCRTSGRQSSGSGGVLLGLGAWLLLGRRRRRAVN